SALLLGSDYTRGIKGVGEVNTLEILSAFPGDQGLRTFAEWLQGLYKARELEELASLKPTKKQVAELDPAMRFMYTHRSARTKWSAPSEFPSRMVMQAYLRPTVSSSTEPFTWTLPQVDPIKALCANAFGWDAQTTESHINPVLTALTKGSGQSSLHQFFITKYDDGVRAAAVRSSRMRTALKGLHGREDDSDIAISAQKASRGTKRPADLDMQELDDAQLAGLDLELAANGSTPPRATPARSKRSRA
ncbi:UVH3, partial [Symbiodinium sp. KB8]